MADGRWQMEDGRWKMEDGKCNNSNGAIKNVLTVSAVAINEFYWSITFTDMP